MRTKVLTLLMSVAFIGASAQTIIKEVSLGSETPLASVLSDEEMLTADSLVIKGFLKSDDYSTMRKMCQEGRLRGIDLSGVVQDRSGLAIPDNAFYTGGSDSGTETVKVCGFEPYPYIHRGRFLQGLQESEGSDRVLA